MTETLRIVSSGFRAASGTLLPVVSVLASSLETTDAPLAGCPCRVIGARQTHEREAHDLRDRITRPRGHHDPTTRSRGQDATLYSAPQEDAVLTGATSAFDEALDAQPYRATSSSDVTPRVVAVAEALLHIDVAVVLIKPRSKQPMCTAGARTYKGHPCGVHHVITRDPRPDGPYGPQLRHGLPALRSAVSRLRRQDIDVSTLNLAVQPRLSRMVCVDIDTAAQYGNRWTEHDLTVRTPGTADGVHSGGGHVWLTIPDTISDADLSRWSDIHHADGWVAKIDGYALIPPSVRNTGPYEHVGAVRMWQ